MAGQGQAANLRCAGIHHMKQHSLARFDADRLAVAEHSAVDAEELVPDLVAFRHAARARGAHRGFAGSLQLRIGGRRHEKVHVHVATATQRGFELLQREEDFAVELSGLASGLDVHRAGLRAVETGIELTAGDEMGMVKTQSRGSGCKADTPHAMRWNVRRAFLRGTVDIDR